ncbi:MAG: hypothetical protein HRU19_31410 [Pseudobacteriovorax sp.]|nr:hypothetical protein [Pseudobacteriovorax sp.]
MVRFTFRFLSSLLLLSLSTNVFSSQSRARILTNSVINLPTTEPIEVCAYLNQVELWCEGTDVDIRVNGFSVTFSDIDVPKPPVGEKPIKPITKREKPDRFGRFLEFLGTKLQTGVTVDVEYTEKNKNGEELTIKVKVGAEIGK